MCNFAMLNGSWWLMKGLSRGIRRDKKDKKKRRTNGEEALTGGERGRNWGGGEGEGGGEGGKEGKKGE